MTYKDKVQEIYPEKVVKHACGGVIGCPSVYFDMDDNCTIIWPQIWNKKSCTACWNREYKGEPIIRKKRD